MRSSSRFSFVLAAATAALLPILALAAESPIGRLVANATTIEWQPSAEHANIVLSVQRPDGQVFTETFAAGNHPMLRLQDLADGAYAYELRVVSNEPGQEQFLVQSGTFAVANGAMLSPNAPESRPPARPITNPDYADDVTALGGVCAGSDCVAGESYGFASIKMKENNTRLKFEDTSTTAGFASTDWQLSANDTSSGGANKLFVEDLTAGTSPFVIEGATPSNTLYVDSNGRVGVRTSTPAKTLHLADPVYPAIRMENTTSPLQNWDVVASNNNFLIRDVNHESDPFIIKTNAAYYSLVIDTNGRIGLGVSSPLYSIHHSSGARLDGGVWIDASSRAVKQDIHDLDRDAALDALRSLQPVTFAYKTNPADTHVGFIAEDVPELVATPDRTGLAPMDVVAVLTKVIQEQQKTIDDMRSRLDCIERE
jgi:hypothetical protein